MQNEFNPDLVTVVDEEGIEHTFEELDRVETDNNKYVALMPVFDNSEDVLDDDGELIILKVLEEDGECYLISIEDNNEFEEIGAIFEERLKDMFEITE